MTDVELDKITERTIGSACTVSNTLLITNDCLAQAFNCLLINFGQPNI